MPKSSEVQYQEDVVRKNLKDTAQMLKLSPAISLLRLEVNCWEQTSLF